MVHIDSNGSHWAGARPDGIEALFERLASFPLNPDFEDYGNFITPARLAHPTQDPDTLLTVYEDAGPIYPESPDALRFWGNFYELSAVFCIDTDEPELIERLTAAIRANQATPAYQAARSEIAHLKQRQPATA